MDAALLPRAAEVYIRAGCPWCDAALALLAREGVRADVRLPTDANTAELRARWSDAQRRRAAADPAHRVPERITYPQIFRRGGDDGYVGGHDDLVAFVAAGGFAQRR